jgi:CMP/dCMP kinase
MIIAIDGPSASGKGVIGRQLAEHFELAYLDTGLLFRAIGHDLITRNVDISDEKEALKSANKLLDYDYENQELRTEKVGRHASIVSTYAEVRDAVLSFERNYGKSPPKNKKGAVLDGRDIGTVVFPDAYCKIFVTADLETRAKRRYEQLIESELKCIYEDVLQDLRDRDARDQNRKIAPLLPAKDAHIVDTTLLTVEEAIERIVNLIKVKQAQKSGRL